MEGGFWLGWLPRFCGSRYRTSGPSPPALVVCQEGTNDINHFYDDPRIFVTPGCGALVKANSNFGRSLHVVMVSVKHSICCADKGPNQQATRLWRAAVAHRCLFARSVNSKPAKADASNVGNRMMADHECRHASPAQYLDREDGFVVLNAHVGAGVAGGAVAFLLSSVRCHTAARSMISDKPGLSVICIADSDEVARSFRDHVARYSDMMSPARGVLLALVFVEYRVCGQSFDLGRMRRRLSPARSMRWALWTRRSRMASA